MVMWAGKEKTRHGLWVPQHEYVYKIDTITPFSSLGNTEILFSFHSLITHFVELWLMRTENGNLAKHTS